MIRTDFYASQNTFGSHLDGHESSYIYVCVYIHTYTHITQAFPAANPWHSESNAGHLGIFSQEAEGCSCRALGQSCIPAHCADKIPTPIILRRQLLLQDILKQLHPQEAHTPKDSSKQRLTSIDQRGRSCNHVTIYTCTSVFKLILEL